VVVGKGVADVETVGAGETEAGGVIETGAGMIGETGAGVIEEAAAGGGTGEDRPSRSAFFLALSFARFSFLLSFGGGGLASVGGPASEALPEARSEVTGNMTSCTGDGWSLCGTIGVATSV